MALVLKVAGVDRSSSVDWHGLAWTSVLTKEVDRLEFHVAKTATKTIPTVGQDIILEEDGTRLFGGVVVERNEEVMGGVLLGYHVRCKDYSHLLDGKLVVENYAGDNAGDIVEDIIAQYTTGFTTAAVQTGPTVGSIKFNYEQVSRALTALADQCGYDWYVDPYKDIHFIAEETAAAPFGLTDTSANFIWGSLEVNESIVNLKNSIYIRGGEYKKTYTAGSAYDEYEGDGVKTVYHLAFRYDDITVKVNGVAQSIGTDQTGDPILTDCVYNFSEKFIRFLVAPIAGDEVVIYGDAFIPVIAAARDNGSIAAYGEFQQAIIDKSITSVAEAQARAIAELRKYSESVHEGRFKTTTSGLRVGQSITIVSAIRAINKSFKINRIVGKPRTSGTMEYEVYLLASGEITMTDMMVGLLNKDKQNIIIAPNEVLQKLEVALEELAIGDSIGVPTPSTGPYKWGADANALVWGFGTWE